MSKTGFMRFLPLLLALLLVFSASFLAVSAEEDESNAESAVSDEASGTESAAETSEAEASGTESKAETSGAESEASGEASTEASAEESGTTSEASEEETSSNVPWKLIITVAVIVVLIAVLFILTRTNTKVGQKVLKFFKDYKSELKKITWMPWKDLVKATATVLVILAVAAVVIGLLDYGFSTLVKLLSKVGG